MAEVILSVVLRPGELEFKAPAYSKKFRVNGSNAFDIEHGHGKVEVEVRDGRLLVGWSPTDELVPNSSITASYHRPDDLFYPELLIPVTAPLEVVPRH